MAEIFNPSSTILGKYGKYDGTIELYGRIHAILLRDSVVLDFGAGRGGWYIDMVSSFAKSVQALKPDVLKVTGWDVDEAVLENPSTGNLFLRKK